MKKDDIKYNPNKEVREAYEELEALQEANFYYLKRVFKRRDPKYDNSTFENFIISYAKSL